MERVWERLKRCHVFKGKGTKTKLGRWFSWWDRAEGRLEGWHEVLFFLTFLGIRRRFWPTLEDSPLADMLRCSRHSRRRSRRPRTR